MKFNDSWCNKFKFIQKAAKGEGFAWCTLCGSDFSVVHGGENDINRYTSKHKLYLGCCTTRKDINRFRFKLSHYKLRPKVVKVEIRFSVFLVEHNLPMRTENHAAKLFRNMFSDSKILKKYLCDRTKTTHMLTRVVSEQITSDLKESYCWLAGTDQQRWK